MVDLTHDDWWRSYHYGGDTIKLMDIEKGEEVDTGVKVGAGRLHVVSDLRDDLHQTIWPDSNDMDDFFVFVCRAPESELELSNRSAREQRIWRGTQERDKESR